MIPCWAAEYVGLPFKDKGRDRNGLDCWGLVALVMREQFGIELPSYADNYVSAMERDEIAALLTASIPSNGWQPVADAAQAGDGVVFRVLNAPWHVGIVLDAEHFLHVVEGGGCSLIERLDSHRWVRRIVGIYRHPLAVAR